jgi:hypothetical protein
MAAWLTIGLLSLRCADLRCIYLMIANDLVLQLDAGCCYDACPGAQGVVACVTLVGCCMCL